VGIGIGGVWGSGDSASVDVGPHAHAVIAHPWLSSQHSAWCGESQLGHTVTSVPSLIGKRQYGQFRPAMSAAAFTTGHGMVVY
jgi:hypothetical protein